MAAERLSLEKRIKCVRLFSATNNVTEIRRRMAQEYGDPPPNRQTIVRINKLFDDTGSVLDVKKPGRPREARTPRNVDLLAAEF